MRSRTLFSGVEYKARMPSVDCGARGVVVLSKRCSSTKGANLTPKLPKGAAKRK